MSRRSLLPALLGLLILPALTPAKAFPGKAFTHLTPAAKRAAAPISAQAGAPAVVQAPALEKPDVIGFWSMDVEAGLDVQATFESFFSSNGTWEGRARLTQDGLTQTVDGFGTWTLKNDTITVAADTSRCIAKGEPFVDCSDPSPSFYIVRIDGTTSTLVDVSDADELDVGEYKGAQKAFTLPDFFTAAIYGARGNARHARQEPRIRVSGTGMGDETGARIFEVTGRMSGPRGAAGIRVSTPENP